MRTMNDAPLEGSIPPSDAPQTAPSIKETQPEDKILSQLRQELVAGDFATARRLVRTSPAQTPPEARDQLADHARRLAPDLAAWLVACAVGVALAATAAITLFH